MDQKIDPKELLPLLPEGTFNSEEQNQIELWHQTGKMPANQTVIQLWQFLCIGILVGSSGELEEVDEHGLPLLDHPEQHEEHLESKEEKYPINKKHKHSKN